MSTTTPIQFEVSEPIGVDAKIAEIQKALKTASLPWNEISFARAYKHARLKDGSKVYYPAVFQGTGKDYLSLFPNDNLGSYSFTYLDQPQDLLEADTDVHYFEGEIKIIVVYQPSKIGTLYDNRFSERLKYDVIQALYLVPDLIVNQTYDEIDECFSDFSVEDIESQFLSDRYGALRFDCSVKFSNDCQIINTYA